MCGTPVTKHERRTSEQLVVEPHRAAAASGCSGQGGDGVVGDGPEQRTAADGPGVASPTATGAGGAAADRDAAARNAHDHVPAL